MRTVLFLFIGCLLSYSNSLQSMNGWSPIGYGVKAKGMGGVATAFPQDSFVVATNPAGLHELGSRVDGSFEYVGQNGGARERDANGVLLPGAEYFSSQGVLLPGIAGAWRVAPCHTLGLAAYVLGAGNVNYNQSVISLSGASDAPDTSLRTYFVNITPSWAWRLSRSHVLGIALNIAVASLEVRGIQAFQADSLDPLHLSNQGNDWSGGVSVRAGWLVRIHKEVQLGLSVQTKTWMQKMKRYQGFLVDGGNWDYPSRMDMGASWHVIPKLFLAGDYSLLFWSECDSLGHLGQGQGGAFGATDGPGLGWNCQSVVRVGIHWCACDWLVLRGGIHFATTPIDSTQTQLNQLTLAVQQMHLTAGATVCACGGEFSLFGYYAFRKQIEGEDSDILRRINNYDLRNAQAALGLSYGRRF